MAYLTFNTPIPAPLPSDLQAELLAIPPADVRKWLKVRDRKPVDFHVNNAPYELDGEPRMLVHHRRGAKPSGPAELSPQQAFQYLKTIDSSLLPDQAEPTVAQQEALCNAFRDWLREIQAPKYSPAIPPAGPHVHAPMLEWLFDGNRGVSSQAIAKAAFTGQAPDRDEGRPPADRSDFMRCVRLIERIPQVTTGMTVLARQDSRWDFLQDNWHILTELIQKGRNGRLNDILRRNYHNEIYPPNPGE